MTRERKSRPALKMHEAHHPVHGVVQVRNVQPQGLAVRDYRCIDCRTPVRYVPPSRARKDLPDVRERRAYFGRTQTSEHGDRCTVLLHESLQRWIADEVLDDLVDRAGTATCFRIDALRRVLQKAREISSDPTDTHRSGQESFLPRVISKASDLIRLLGTVEGGDLRDLNEVLRLSFNGRPVRWRDFFFTEDRLFTLWRRLQAQRGWSTYPMGCTLTIRFVTTAANSWSAQCEPINGRDGTIVHPWINGTGSRVPRCVQAGAEVAVLGYVSSTSSAKHNNLRVAVWNAKQVCDLYQRAATAMPVRSPYCSPTQDTSPD
jgi:hypothetical protein